MEIICVNSKFDSKQLEFYKVHGVITPQENSLYTIRDVITNSNGKKGLLLEEIINPHIPIIHPILGTAFMEPNWDIIRFTDLEGNVITMEMLRKITKQIKDKDFILINKKENVSEKN